jgi:hypothetical protein
MFAILSPKRRGSLSGHSDRTGDKTVRFESERIEETGPSFEDASRRIC